MKFRVFHVMNRTVFSGWLDQAFSGFVRKYEVNEGRINDGRLFAFLLALELFHDSDIKTGDVLGEDDDTTLFSVASSLIKA